MRPWAFALTGSALLALVPAAAASWSGPVAVGPRDGAAYAVPDGAVEAGRAVAAWVRAPSGTRGRARVQVSTRAEPAARWSPPQTLSGPGVDAPRVAMNARGDAVVAWVRGRRIAAAVRRGPTGDWTAAPVVDAAGGVQETRVAVDRSGRPTVLWSERVGEGFAVRVASRPTRRAGWSVRPPRVTTPGPAPPALALGRSGALVAWTEDGGTRAARTHAGAFERPLALSRDAGPPAAAVGGSRRSVVAWSAVLPGGTSVMLAAGRSAGAATWDRSRDLGIGMRPVVALNDRGDAAVAWSIDDPGAPQGIAASTRQGGGSWHATSVTPRRACECALTAAAAAIDGRGVALVGWRRDDGGPVGGGGAASLAPGDAVWSRARLSPGRTRRAPAVAADRLGGGIALWVEAGPGGGVRAVTLRR